VEWGYNVARSDVPWHQPVRGRALLPRFFGALAENVAMSVFEPKSFLTAANQVAVHLRIEYTVKRTGKKVAMDHLHLWTFDEQGRVKRLVHFEDTAQVIDACAA
jgi:ketosteroid isomerase-like protein